MNNFITILDQGQAELREELFELLRSFNDADLVYFQRTFMRKYNTEPDEMSYDFHDKMAYVTGVGQISLWIEEFLASTGKDLTEANKEYEKMLDDVADEVFCSVCEFRKDLCTCDE